MSRKTHLVIILITTLTITSLVSHIGAHVLKIRTDAVTPLSFGATNQPVNGVVAGSSLMFYGVGWADNPWSRTEE